ncbi:Dol-P-Man:Man(7)GlcNAc(2)-PP-Dol alpha-1,6-mannosyltransferase [Diatrype stigma]|uniref:Mannosyltransferase n=1 Tax=Diatrype stigma TaxID=117547 RepID=A0AAN9UEX1_9PEZI
MAALDLLLSLSIPALIIAHLLIAPYTKVEESFNIQATHDILVYGTPTSNIKERLALYDHFEFPGAVPRTFVGPVLLAGISQPLIALIGSFQHAQLVVRAVLGLANAAALLVFKANVERAFGRSVARWYALLQASQFHVMFYASRTLPNMFAFGFTTLAFSQLLPLPLPDSRKQTRRFRLAIALLTFATAVFRSELAILLVAVTLYHGLLSSAAHRPLVSFGRIVLKPFLSAFAFALLVSVPLDSYFWQRWPPVFWPELWGFYYNAVLGSSSAWGVSPWHWYFTSALPRILTNPLAFPVLLPLALFLGGGTNPATRGARRVAAPALLFVAIYSLQPHKEARFVFYAAPPLTAAAALGADFVWARRARSAAHRLAALAVAASVPLSLAAAAAMLAASSLNYPGGEALNALLRGDRGLVVAPDLLGGGGGGTVVVHTGVLSCMTGVTLFGQHPTVDSLLAMPASPSSSRKVVQQHAGTDAEMRAEREKEGGSTATTRATMFTFDKTEDPVALRNPAFWERFDYVLAEDPAAVLGGRSWEVVGVVEGFAGIEMAKPGLEEESGGKGGGDLESGSGGGRDYRIVGRGELVRQIKDRVRSLTGGWWIGPRMVPKVYILRRMREGEGRKAVAE